MAQRGRKSKADLAIVNETSAVERPIPPVDLSVEQKNEWLTLVNSHAADYFGPETLPLLESYCRHRVTMRHVGQLIRSAEDAEEFDVVHYDRLLKMQERESRCLASLAVRLGFAKTTAYSPKSKSTVKKPWDFEAK